MRNKIRALMLSNADVLSRLLSVTWLMTFSILLVNWEADPGTPVILITLINVLLVAIIVSSLVNLLRVTFWGSLLSGSLISVAFLVDMVAKIMIGDVLGALPLLTIVVSIPIAGFVAFTMDQDLRDEKQKPKDLM